MADHQRRCDVVVVGAGVSGLLVAKDIKRRGHSVMVVDQRMEPGRNQSFHGIVPASGIVAATGSVEVLNAHGLRLGAVWDLDGRSSPLTGSWSLRHSVLLDALKRGLDFVSSRTVALVRGDEGWGGVRCDDGVIEADVTVLADGSDPRLAEGPLLRPDWPPTALLHLGKRRYPVNGQDDDVRTWSGRTSWDQDGWGYLVPGREDVTVVAAMVLEDAMTSNRHVLEVLDDVVEHQWLGTGFDPSRPCDEFTEVIPIGGYDSVTRLVRDGVVLVSTAHGLSNPMACDGIGNVSVHESVCASIDAALRENGSPRTLSGRIAAGIDSRVIKPVAGRRPPDVRPLHTWMSMDQDMGLRWHGAPNRERIGERTGRRLRSIVRSIRTG